VSGSGLWCLSGAVVVVVVAHSKPRSSNSAFAGTSPAGSAIAISSPWWPSVGCPYRTPRSCAGSFVTFQSSRSVGIDRLRAGVLSKSVEHPCSAVAAERSRSMATARATERCGSCAANNTSCRNASVVLAVIELAHRIRKRQFSFGLRSSATWLVAQAAVDRALA